MTLCCFIKTAFLYVSYIASVLDVRVAILGKCFQMMAQSIMMIGEDRIAKVLRRSHL